MEFVRDLPKLRAVIATNTRDISAIKTWVGELVRDTPIYKTEIINRISAKICGLAPADPEPVLSDQVSLVWL